MFDSASSVHLREIVEMKVFICIKSKDEDDDKKRHFVAFGYFDNPVTLKKNFFDNPVEIH